MLGHKTSPNKFKKIEIISTIFSSHNGVKLETNHRKQTGKITNMWRLNNMLLNNQWISEEIKAEIKKYLRQMKMKIQHTKIYWMKQKQF